MKAVRTALLVVALAVPAVTPRGVVAAPAPAATAACVPPWSPQIKSAQLQKLEVQGAHAYETGDFKTALGIFQRAIALAQQLKEDSASTFMSFAGVVETAMGRYGDGLKYDQAALRWDRQISGGFTWAIDYSNIGEDEERLGHYSQGLDAENSALSLARLYDQCDIAAGALTAIGHIQGDLGQYSQGLRSLQDALALYNGLGVEHTAASAALRADMSILHQRLRQYSLAVSDSQEAFRLHQSLRDTIGEGRDLLHIGDLFMAIGDYERSGSVLAQSLAIFKQLREPHEEGIVLLSIAELQRHRKRYAQALADVKQATALDVALREDNDWGAHSEAAYDEMHLGRAADAIADFNAALRDIEEQRASIADPGSRTTYFEQVLPIYDTFAEYLARRHDANGALAVFEKRQARVFLEEIAASAAQRFSGIPPTLIQQQRTLNAQIQLHQSNVDSLVASRERYGGKMSGWEREERASLIGAQRQLRAVEAQIAKYPGYAELQHPHLLDAQQIAHSVLHRDEAMLLYDVLADATILWVVTPATYKMFVLNGGTSAARAKVAAFLDGPVNVVQNRADGTAPTAMQRIAGQNVAAFAKASRDLYDWLLPASARSMVPAGATLFIVPTGPLYGLPFEALVTKPFSPARDARPRYLIDDHAVAYLSSGSLLGVLRFRHRSQAPQPLLAFANPAYASNDFSPLRGSEEEVRAAAARLGPGDPAIYLHDAASAATVKRLNDAAKLQEYRYVIFATHVEIPDGVTADTQPRLVLANYPDHGYLTMADVFGLSFNARLIMLSACDSNAQATTGDGIQSLTRAFMYAGTPAVTVTDWKILDWLAPAFSSRFFSYLAQRKTPADALRRTKIDLIDGKIDVPGAYADGFSHPFFWAATVLFGDGAAASR